MSNKRILILNGHPGDRSLSRLFTETYAMAARSAGHEVRLTHLQDLDFDMDFGGEGYGNYKPLEPGLETLLQDIEWAQHVVLATPLWWGGLPAKLKGMFDRMLIPGRTFDTRNTKMGMPSPVLTGRTGRVILTSDTPRWFMRLMYGSALLRQMTGQIFGFVGIKPTRYSYFSGASHPKPGAVEKWVNEVHRIGVAAL